MAINIRGNSNICSDGYSHAMKSVHFYIVHIEYMRDEALLLAPNDCYFLFFVCFLALFDSCLVCVGECETLIKRYDYIDVREIQRS